MQADRVLLLEPSGRKHLVALEEEMIRVPQVGVVRADILRSSIGRRWSIGGRTFLVLTASVRDLAETLQRKAQIIGPKDLPSLIWNCGLKAGDFAVEVGAGSGALTIALAQAVGPTGRVVTYDVRRDFLANAQRNVAAAGLSDRVEFKVADARRGIPEREADAFLVDIPDPWEIVGTASDVLQVCAHFASYSPNMEQVHRTVEALRSKPFVEIRSTETIEREIEVHEAGTRPAFTPLGHTGYLTFARKVLDTF